MHAPPHVGVGVVERNRSGCAIRARAMRDRRTNKTYTNNSNAIKDHLTHLLENLEPLAIKHMRENMPD